MKQLKVGVIGLGRFGILHANIYSRLPHTDLVAVCSRSSERVEEVANACNARTKYTDWRDVVQDPEVDAVSIVTETSRHTEIACEAIARGKHILMEKPLAANLADAHKVLDAAEKAKIIFMVGYILRFDNRHALVKERISRGELGEIASIYARRNVARTLFETYNAVNPFAEAGIHDVDLAGWYLDDRVKSVYAVKRHMQNPEAPDVCWAVLTFSKGAVCVIEQIWLVPDKAPWGGDIHLEVIGTKGTIKVRDPSNAMSIWTDDGVEHPDTQLWPTLYGNTAGDLKEELSYFADCVLQGRQPTIVPPGKDIEILKVCAAITESCETGIVVNLP